MYRFCFIGFNVVVAFFAFVFILLLFVGFGHARFFVRSVLPWCVFCCCCYCYWCNAVVYYVVQCTRIYSDSECYFFYFFFFCCCAACFLWSLVSSGNLSCAASVPISLTHIIYYSMFTVDAAVYTMMIAVWIVQSGGIISYRHWYY